jgi:hypothetical protein
MSPWFQIVLFLHVFGAILAFGPTYAYPIIGAMGGKEPMHANFATRVTEAIGMQRVYPLAILQGVTGVLLIFIANVDLTKSLWLGIAIVLYVLALSFAFTIQRNAVHHLIEVTTMPAGGPPAGGPPPGAPAGPPPGVREAVAKVQRGGIILGITIAVIVFLMVTKLSF